MKSGKFEFIPAETIADSISAGAPRNLYMAADAIEKSGGRAISVTDDEIISAQKIVAQEFGILSEPSSAATMAGYIKLKNENQINEKDKILLLITGNGLKDTNSLLNWNVSPKVLSYNEWLVTLDVK